MIRKLKSGNFKKSFVVFHPICIYFLVLKLVSQGKALRITDALVKYGHVVC